ncbi:hypothetical protein [Kitasatospora sp. NPDC057223]|uniref:hypothetical protein n=1 Tax=Kitasatospora sp. NPDC057223 TaxID=3346055 RepID=UPI00363CBE3E
MTVHPLDELTGLADPGGEVAAGVTGEGPVEETAFGGGDVVPAAVTVAGDDGQEAGGTDADAVDGGGEDLVGLAMVPGCPPARARATAGCWSTG